jgi:hypothetical protein
LGNDKKLELLLDPQPRIDPFKRPLELNCLNSKRDSEYEATERKVREKKAKKNAKVVRFTLRIKTKRQLPERRLVALPVNPVTKTAVPQNNNFGSSEKRRVYAELSSNPSKRFDQIQKGFSSLSN